MRDGEVAEWTATAHPLTADERVAERTAIVHDWFQGFHGSERVVETMRAGLFRPQNSPDIYTFHAARDVLPPALVQAIVRESRLSRLPGVRQRGFDSGRWRYLLPYMPRFFDRLRLEGYDLVISSAHAFAKNVRTRPDALHLCYCYTPTRYLWLPETERDRVTGVKARALAAANERLRRADLAAAARPDAYVAISTAVRERIRRFYGRDAVVIAPPVDVEEFDPTPEKEPGRFLWVHRLVPYKRPELVAEAFRGLPYHLTMIGVGPLERRLRERLPENVELLGWVSREELARRYATAAGFIHVGEEDFGITVVEALASGTPAVVLARGGATDIVRDGRDGVFVERVEIETLRAAIHRLQAESWDPRDLAERAAAFSRSAFLRRLATHIRELQAQRS